MISFVSFVSFRCIWLVLSRLLCCIPSCCCIVGYTFHDDGPKGDYEETHKRPAGRTNNQLEYQSSCPLYQQLLLLLTYFFGLPIFISFHFLSRFFSFTFIFHSSYSTALPSFPSSFYQLPASSCHPINNNNNKNKIKKKKNKKRQESWWTDSTMTSLNLTNRDHVTGKSNQSSQFGRRGVVT